MVVSPQSLCHCAVMNDLQNSIIYAVTLWVKLFDSLRVPPQKSPHSGLTRTTQLEAGKILLDVVNSAKRIVYSLSFPPKLIIIINYYAWHGAQSPGLQSRCSWKASPGHTSVASRDHRAAWPNKPSVKSESLCVKHLPCVVANCVAQAGDTWEHGWC